MSIESIYSQLQKNIEQAKTTGKLTADLLFQNLPAGILQTDFIQNIFNVKEFIFNIVEPVFEEKKVAINFKNLHVLNADDVSVMISFEEIESKIIAGFQVQSDQQIKLPSFLDTLKVISKGTDAPELPGGLCDLGNIGLSNLKTTIDTGALLLTLANIDIEANEWKLPGMEELFTLKTAKLKLSMKNPMKSSERDFSGDVSASLIVPGVDSLDFNADLRKFELNTKALGVNLVKLAEYFNATLPEILPQVESDLNFTIKPKTNEYNFAANMLTSWEFAGGGLDSKITFNLDHAKSEKEFTTTAKITATKTSEANPLSLIEGLNVNNYDYKFDATITDKKTDWKFEGTTNIGILKSAFDLKTELKKEGDTQTVHLASTQQSGDVVIDLPELGGQLKKFDFDVTVTNKKGGTPVTGKIDTTLNIPPLKELTLKAQMNGKLSLNVDVTTNEIKLSDLLQTLYIPIPDDLPQIEAEGSYHLSYSPLTEVKEEKAEATNKPDSVSANKVSEFALTGDTTVKWTIDEKQTGANANFKFYRRLQQNGNAGKKLTSVELNVVRAKDTGTIPINDELKISDFNFGFNYNKSEDIKSNSTANDTDWIVSGDMNLELFGNEFKLDAAAKDGAVILHSESKDIQIGEIGSIQNAKFLAELVKQKGTKKENIKGEAKWVDPKDAPKVITGKVLEFNGKDACVNGGLFISPGNQISVEAWLCPSDFSEKPVIASFAKGNEMLFYIGENGELCYSDSNNKEKKSDKKLEKNKWSHIAFVLFNKGKLNFYINGENAGSINLQEDFPTIQPHLTIGAQDNSSGFFKGQLSDVRLWDRVRSADEIKNNKDKCLTADEAGVTNYFMLDEGEGKTAGDKTKNSFFSGKVEGTLKLNNSSAAFGLYLGIRKNLLLQASASNIKLSEIAEAMQIEIPDAMPEITSALSLNLLRNADSKKWNVDLSAAAKTEWQIQEQEETLFESEVSFYLQHNAAESTTNGKFRFFAKSNVSVIEEIKFSQFDFSIAKTKDKWTVDSDSKLEVLDKPIEIGFNYTYDNVQKLNIFMKSVESLMDIDCLQFNVDKFGIDIEKKDKKTNWTVKADTTLKIDPNSNWEEPLVNLGGKVMLEKLDDVLGLSLIPKKASIPIPLVEGENATGFVFEFESLRFKLDSKSKEWSIKARTCAKLKNFPSELENILPEDLHKKLKKDGVEPFFEATQKSISIGVEDIFDSGPLDAKVKLADSHGATVNNIDLGKFEVKVSDFKLTLSNALNLSINFGIALPSKLNYIFGEKTEGGKTVPCIELFNVYNEKEPEKTIFTNLEASFGILKNGSVGIGLTIVSSPLKGLPIDKDGNMDITLGKDGEYGEFHIQIPQMSDSGASFAVSGGYKVIKQISVPLEPLKQLFILWNLKDVAEMLPKKIPLEQFNWIQKHGSENPKDWTLATTDLINDLRKILPEVDLSAIEEPLKIIEKEFHYLPTELIRYLDMSWPTGLTFKLSITADGGVNFEIATEGEPLRMLSPCLQPMPGLQGISLRSVSFGEILSGSLFLLKWDGNFDIFDLPSIAETIAMKNMEPVLEKFHLPKPADFHRKVIIQDLYTVIVYETEIPIPIPLFYKELGFDMVGVEGVNIQAHAHFGWDQPILSSIAKALLDIYKFVTDENYHLPVKNPPQIFPVFKLNDWYIELPGYLGGQIIGQKGELVKIDFNTYGAYLLNGIKFFSLRDFISLIPVEYRVNSVGAHVPIKNFVCIDMEAAWLITTPQEYYTQEVYKQIVKTKEEADELFQVLPDKANKQQIQPTDEGLVIFLKGSWNSSLAGFNVAFGLIAVDSKKFITGFDIKGFIINMLDVHIKATLQIDPPETPFQLKGEGKTRFQLLGLNIIDGETTVSADIDKFEITGTFSLLPKDFPVHFCSKGKGIGGTLAKDSIDLSAGIEAQFFFIKITGNAFISDKKGILFRLSVPPKKLEFSVTKATWKGRESIKVYGTLPIFVDDYASTTFIDPASNSFGQTLESTFFQLVKTTLNFDLNLAQKYSSTGVTGSATVHSNLTNHNMLDGAVKVLADGFDLRGDFYLFPPSWPANVKGSNNQISINAKGFNINGNLSANFGPISIANASVSLNSQGFKISGKVFGQGISALVKDDGAYINFSFNVLFGPLSTKVTVRIRKSDSATTIHFHSDFAGLALDADFNAPSVKGQFYVSIAGQKFLTGNIELNGNEFKLSSSIDFIVTRMSLSGYLGSRGFYIHGSFTVGLPTPVPNIAVEFTINNGYPSIGIKTPIGTGKGMVASFRKKVSILVELAIPIGCRGASLPIYIAVPFGAAPQFYFSRPGDWPRVSSNEVLAASKRTLMSDNSPVVKNLAKEQYQLDDTGVLFEFIERCVISKWHDLYSCVQPVNDDTFLEKAYYTTDCYQMEMEIGEEEEGVTFFKNVKIHKTTLDNDFFNLLQNYIVDKLKDENIYKEEIKKYGTNEILNVTNASARFDKINKIEGQPNASLTLYAKQFTQPIEVVVNFEFKESGKIYDSITEKLLNMKY